MTCFMDQPFAVQCNIFKLIKPEDVSIVCSVSRHWNFAMNDSNQYHMAMDRATETKKLYCLTVLMA